jgi:hypothetical protein
MKLHFIRKLSLLGLVMTLCVAGLGIGYAGWFETLNISGTAVVEFMAVEWVEQETNDPPGHNYVPGIPGADESVMDGFTGPQFRLDKDVGWTECLMLDLDEDGYRETIEFHVHNAYPSYMGKVIGQLMNLGDMWVQVDSVDVTYPQYPGTPEDPYPYDYSSPPTMIAPWPHPPEFEVKWINGAYNLPILIPPTETTQLGCMVHILQAAEQNATYTFRVTFHVSGPVTPPETPP